MKKKKKYSGKYKVRHEDGKEDIIPEDDIALRDTGGKEPPPPPTGGG